MPLPDRKWSAADVEIQPGRTGYFQELKAKADTFRFPSGDADVLSGALSGYAEMVLDHLDETERQTGV